MQHTQPEEPGADTTPLERLRYIIGVTRKSQAMFARSIHLDPSSLSRLLTGKVPITDQFINRVSANLGVSRQWLATGEGRPYLASVSENQLFPRGAAVYDSASLTGTIFTPDNIIGLVDLPGISSESRIVRVNGHSMAPRIPDGSYIAVRRVDSDSIIVWGSAYLVQIEDYRLVRILRPGEANPSRVVLHSENEEFADLEIDRDKIGSLYIIDTIIKIETIS